MPNPTVAVLLHAADVRACVSAGARPWYTVRPHACLAELLETLRTIAVALVVVDAADSQCRSMAPAVAAVRQGFPSVPVLAYCSIPAGPSSALVDVVRAGATGLIIRGVDDAGYAMRAAITSARRGSVAQRIQDEVAVHIPMAAQPLLRYAIARTGDEPSVDDAAATLGVDRKTLFNWMRRTGRVGPRQFINWIRLAIVVGMLEDPGRTMEHVALEAGFASGTAFRNMLRRYTGLHSSEIRAEGSFDMVLSRFLSLLGEETDVDACAPMVVSGADIDLPAHRRGA